MITLQKLSKVHYFSDGCAGQYKNCKDFLNLCLHNSDFRVKCEWNFFATSYGKSPCDGIGETVKRLVTRASLQRPTSNQILTADKMFEICVEEIKGIDFLFLKNQEIGNIRINMEERYKRADTAPGWGIHCLLLSLLYVCMVDNIGLEL